MNSSWGILGLSLLGGALGGGGRHWVSGWAARRWGERFPVGTLVVNVSGAFGVGLVWAGATGAGAPWAAEATDFLMLGVLGGYTTVSSFSLQTVNLMRDGQWGWAAVNVLGSWGGCLLAVVLGSSLGYFLQEVFRAPISMP